MLVCSPPVARQVCGRFTAGNVVVEADCLAVGTDADQQRSALGVEEARHGLHDGVLDGLAGLALAQVPSGGGLELDGVVLVIGDQLVDGAELWLSGQAELLGAEGDELGGGAGLFVALVGGGGVAYSTE